MEPYDRFREEFADASAEEKLMIIRSESMRILGLVAGYASLMLQIVEERTPPELPDDFKDWCKKVADGSREMRDLIDAVTDRAHRTILEEEQAKHKYEFNKERWEYTRARVPELQGYESLFDAFRHAVQSLGLAFTEDSSSAIRIEAPSHPDGSLWFRSRERQANFGVQYGQPEGQYKPIGYAVTLSQCVDPRNLTWQDHEGLASSLDDAVIVVSRWLIDVWELDRIKLEYPWMNRKPH